MKANNEDVKVTELSFVASSTQSTIVNNISEISLWDGSTKLAYTNNISASSTVSGLSLIIPQTEKTYTIKVKLNKYGKDQTAELDKYYEFGLEINEAQGNSSGDDVTGATTTLSKNVAVVATKISAVSFESTNGSVSIASKLTSDSDVNSAIIKVTAPSYMGNTDSTGNEIKTIIKSIKVKVDGSAASSTGATTTIERLGGSGTTVATTTESGYATLGLTQNSIYNVLAAGETAYYLVKIHTKTWDGSTNSGTMSLTVNLDALNGGNIVWNDGGADKTSLRLPGVTKIDGITLTN
jgi:hypothetical protein